MTAIRLMAAATTTALLALLALTGCRDDERVEALLDRLTLDEKIELLHGAPESPATTQGEAGFLPGIARLGISPLRFADGPPGVLTRYPATGLTATMGVAATFSRDDARANGSVIARDAAALGIDVVLEPYINIHRDQTFARAYNTFGEDPLLTGEIGAAEVEGIQDNGIMAQAKHYIAYDGANEVSVDAQTLHEIYLAPFASVIAANVASIMCSYNVVNGAYACGNHDTLDTILRGEMGFRGFVTSDWGATHATDFINAGQDIEMPGSGSDIDSFITGTHAEKEPLHPLFEPPSIVNIPEETPWVSVPGPRLTGKPPIGVVAAMAQGIVSEGTITEAARRVLRELVRFGHVDGAHSGVMPTGIESPEAVAANAAVVRRTSLDAAVLLKNDGAALPLSSGDLSSLAMIGPGALQDIAIGEAGEKALGRIERQIGPVAALEVASGSHVSTAVADDMTGTAIPAAQFGSGLVRRTFEGQQLAIDATLDFTSVRGNALPTGTSAEWTGVLRVPHEGRYRLSLQILGARGSLTMDGKRIASTGRLSLHGNVLQPGQDNVLATTDGLDDVRRELALPAGEHTLTVRIYGESVGQPVQVRLAWVTPEQRAADYQRAIDVAKAARKVVLFVWARHDPPFHLPGDQDQLIADVAAANPNTVVVMNLSEPVAMPWLERVKAVLLMWYPGDEGGRAAADLLLGIASPAGRLPFTWPRRLEDGPANDPVHPERSSLGLEGATEYSEGLFVGYRWFDARGIEPLFPFGHGLSYTRFRYTDLVAHHAADGGLDVRLKLSNTGRVASDEVPQLYLGPPADRPAGVQFARRALAAFDRVHLKAGEARTVTLHVAPRALQYWSSERKRWMWTSGVRTVYAGASSRDIRLQVDTMMGAH
jgi:beta-glucosidase